MAAADVAEHEGQEFAAAAKAYCAVIDAHSKLSRKKFLERAFLTLSRLYAAGLHLPAGACTAKVPERRLTSKQWESLFFSLVKKIGEYQFYWEFFDPRSKDEPVAGNLADDLADIYRDVKLGILAYEQGSPAIRRAVVWHWRFLLSSHWGHHATGALYHLQHLYATGHLLRL